MSDQNSVNPRFQFAGQHMLKTPVSPGQIDAGWAQGGAVDPRQMTPQQLQELLPNMQANAYVMDQMRPDAVGPNFWDDQIAGVADAMAAQNNPMDPVGQEELMRESFAKGGDRRPAYIQSLIRALGME